MIDSKAARWKMWAKEGKGRVLEHKACMTDRVMGKRGPETITVENAIEPGSDQSVCAYSNVRVRGRKR
jgi:hypothetical protein